MTNGALSINFEIEGLSKWTRRLDGTARRQIPFATAKAINDTLFQMMDAERQEIKKAFDRPKPFTVKSQKIKKATKSCLTGRLWIKDRRDIPTGNPPASYLRRSIEGTARPAKAFTRALVRAGLLPRGLFVVPAKGARLDKFGNITPAMHRKILASLKAKDGPFFIPRPGHPTLPPGIYRRMARKRVNAVFMFVDKPPKYSPRFDFAGVARKTFQNDFNNNFVTALHRALVTAR